jgi:hypothetical protein
MEHRPVDSRTVDSPTKPESPGRRPPSFAAGAVRSNGKESEKDALIHALTEQLEQAAEQLDRLHRTGADRKRGLSAGGMPADLIEEQRQTVGELQRVVQQWDDMQAGLTLGRIEMQLTELREFVAHRLDGVAVGTPIERGSGIKVHEESVHPMGGGSESAATPADTEWERLKSQLLSGGEPAPSDQPPGPLEPLPEPPGAIDFEQVDRDELIAAVQQRDDFIAALTRRLRLHEVTQPIAELVALGPEAPAFIQRVTDLEQQLQEHLRVAEVELALERAKMARDHSRLHQQQELIDKQLKKLGLLSADDADPSHSPLASNPDRRWMRFLGTGRNE